MIRPSLLWLALLTVWLAPALATAQAFDPAARAAAIAPYLDEQAFGVLHVDLAKAKLAEARKLATTKLPIPEDGITDIERQETAVSNWLAAIQKAGGRELYVVASLADIPARPPFGVLRMSKDADVERVQKLINAGPYHFEDEETNAKPPFEMAVINGDLCLGHANTLARLKEQKPAKKPDLAQAFKVAGDTAVQVVVLQSDDTRRVLTETVPAMPGELSDYSGKDLAAIKYAAIGFDFPPKTSLRIGIQADDEASAARLQKLITDALAVGAEQPPVKQLLPKYEELARLITPKLSGDRLSLMLNEENGGVAKVLALLAQPVQAASNAARRTQSMNNLKMLGLAMHNYHDTHRAFPPAATVKDGKSLLSWRVQILPYIEEMALYEQFHHDEPWDSEHNIKLLEKLPKVLTPPSLDLKPGHTTYLVPNGKGMVFHDGEKNSIATIRDGTSNTIMIVEADAEKAVPWTKPDDLEVDVDKPLAGLGGVWDGGFLATFCDGSVRFIKDTIDPEMLRRLFLKDDGQVIGQF